MVDVIYNAIRRPVANEPSQKDRYRVGRTEKDAKAKVVDDDDAKEGKTQKQVVESYSDREDETSLDERLSQEKPNGKGKYLDKDGKEHLDIFV
ncbi:MAG: hypothetical protein HWE10_10905 [Gammaproteobacteria bacterium]|nr:hypothetical protein [Gammaproteobacteria bacterium]